MRWISTREMLCLTVKLQLSMRITTLELVLLISNFYRCSKLKREGVKFISQTENVVKDITVHVISIQFWLLIKIVGYCLQGLFVSCCIH